MTGPDALTAALRRQAAVLADRLLAAARTRLVARWQADGMAVEAREDGVSLAGRALAARRRGSRRRLADAHLLWPGR